MSKRVFRSDPGLNEPRKLDTGQESHRNNEPSQQGRAGGGGGVKKASDPFNNAIFLSHFTTFFPFKLLHTAIFTHITN